MKKKTVKFHTIEWDINSDMMFNKIQQNGNDDLLCQNTY